MAALPCPYHAIVVSRLTPAGIARLQRCRAAQCGEIRTNSGQAICGRLGASECKAVARWVEFLNGSEGCPHWAAFPEK